MSGYTHNRDRWHCKVMERASKAIKIRHKNSKQSYHYSFGTDPSTSKQSQRHHCDSTF